MIGLVDRLHVSGLALVEVAGRHAVGRLPALRRYIGKLARRPSSDPTPIPLAELEAALGALGVRRGGHVLVHSSWENLRRVEAKPTQVLALLRDLVGPEGTLVMPTFPAETRGQTVYDVARTPSAAGLLTECLRRTPGAVRSPFPIAPVAALGKDAAEYAIDFRDRSGRTPYGVGSPWWRVAEHGGQALFLGIELMRANTLEHCAFDLLGDDNPIPDFYEEQVSIVVRDGQREEWRVRQQRADLEPYLATGAFRRLVVAEGLLAERDLHGLSLSSLDAHAFVTWHVALARRTGLPYFATGLRRWTRPSGRA